MPIVNEHDLKGLRDNIGYYLKAQADADANEEERLQVVIESIFDK